jgi:hypothetical protein
VEREKLAFGNDHPGGEKWTWKADEGKSLIGGGFSFVFLPADSSVAA